MRLESKSREKKKLRKKILIWKWKTSDERFIADASALHKLRKKERLNEFRVREKVTGLISWSDKTYFFCHVPCCLVAFPALTRLRTQQGMKF